MKIKLKAWQIGFIIILIGGLVFAYIDLTYLPQTTIIEKGWWGFGYGVGMVAPLVAIGLGVYYLIKYLYNKQIYRNNITK